MNIDLSPSQQKIVCELLAQHMPECEVRAFGSRVRWTVNLPVKNGQQVKRVYAVRFQKLASN